MAGLDEVGTETTPHVAGMMGAAQSFEDGRVAHGRDAVNAGPGGGDGGPVPDFDRPDPQSWHGEYPSDDGGPDRPYYQTMGQC